jgi:DNA replication protein DnaC
MYPCVVTKSECRTALVERIVHHADTVKIEGERYRLRESQQNADTRSASRRDKK